MTENIENHMALACKCGCVTPNQSAKIAELEAEIARLNAIIEDMKVVDNVFSK